MLNIEDVLVIAQDSEKVTFGMLDGKEYIVVDTRNKVFAMKGFDGLVTFENLYSWYRREKVFFQL